MDITTTNTPIRVIGETPLDAKSMPVERLEALNAVPMNERYYGMTIFVKSEKAEYWLKENLANEGWVKKMPEVEPCQGGIEISGSDVETL